MNEFLLHIRIFDQRKMHHVWIRDVVLVRTFLEDISLSWDLPKTEFDHFFYHLENHRVWILSCLLETMLLYPEIILF